MGGDYSIAPPWSSYNKTTSYLNYSIHVPDVRTRLLPPSLSFLNKTSFPQRSLVPKSPTWPWHLATGPDILSRPAYGNRGASTKNKARLLSVTTTQSDVRFPIPSASTGAAEDYFGSGHPKAPAWPSASRVGRAPLGSWTSPGGKLEKRRCVVTAFMNGRVIEEETNPLIA